MLRVITIGAAVIIGAAAYFGFSGHGGGTDYRDPVQLAKAVKADEHSTAASCGKLATGKYLCTAANADGTSATLAYTVAPDGSSYTQQAIP